MDESRAEAITVSDLPAGRIHEPRAPDLQTLHAAVLLRH